MNANSCSATRAPRLGLLVCDEIATPLREVHGQYPEMFTRLLADTGFDLVPYRVYAGEFPLSVAACDAYLVSGSRRSVYEDLPWIARLSAFLRELHAARRRVVGICFGHQLIGQAMGGRAERAPQGWGLGRQPAEVLHTLAWMQPPAASYALYAVHQDQVTALPPGARRLAHSAHCENAMFVLDDLFLGVQGHPEFERAYAEAITRNKRGIVADEVIDAALSTFAEPVDAALLARWISAFLSGDAPGDIEQPSTSGAR